MPTVRKRTLLGTLARWFSRAVLIGLGGIALLCSLLWIDHRRETVLPSPSGPFAVGRTMQAWTQVSIRSAQLHADAQSTLMAWIWYPSETPPQPPTTAQYLPDVWRRAIEHHAGALLSKILTRDLSRVRTHSLPDAPLSLREPTYPVVLIRAGLAAQTAFYTSLAEDLATHGYVVVGVDAPYRTIVTVLPDGSVTERLPENDADRFTGPQQEQVATRLVREWSSDLSATVDQLASLNASDPSGRFQGRLDMQRVGVVGHSLGGATALQFCHDDVRCKAGIDLDGAPLGNVVADGVHQPFLFLLGDHTGESDAPEVKEKIDAIYDRLAPGQRVLVTVRGANHFGFSDDGALLKSPLVMKLLNAAGVLRMDGRRQIAITAYYINAFFDACLKRAPDPKPLGHPFFPEVAVRQ